MLSRRAITLRSRDARQRSLIAKRAMANHGMRKRKSARDRLFAELVYGRIFMRTGGIVRAWTVIIANVNRLRFLVSSVLLSSVDFATTLSTLLSGRFICTWSLSYRAIGFSAALGSRCKHFRVLVGRHSEFSNMWLSQRTFRPMMVALNTEFRYHEPLKFGYQIFAQAHTIFVLPPVGLNPSKEGAVERAARQHLLELNQK